MFKNDNSTKSVNYKFVNIKISIFIYCKEEFFCSIFFIHVKHNVYFFFKLPRYYIIIYD